MKKLAGAVNYRYLLSLLLSILFAFLIGAGILAVSGFHPLEAYGEYVIVLMNKEFHDIIEYNDPPAMVYGARVSRMILDQILACEGKLYLK